MSAKPTARALLLRPVQSAAALPLQWQHWLRLHLHLRQSLSLCRHLCCLIWSSCRGRRPLQEVQHSCQGQRQRQVTACVLQCSTPCAAPTE